MYRNSSVHGCCTLRANNLSHAYTNQQNRLTITSRYIPITETHENIISGSGQDGEGFLDTIRNLFNKGKSIASKVDKALHGEAGTAITNIIGKVANSDTHRSGFPGERHVILQNSKGRPQKAEWAGPGTNIDARLARGDMGISGVDRAAKRHDLRYGLADSVADVRRADNLFVDEVGRTQDTAFNKKAALAVIKSKMLLENTGLAKPEDFTSFGGMKDLTKRAMYKKVIEQTGLGLGSNIMNLMKAQNKLIRMGKSGDLDKVVKLVKGAGDGYIQPISEANDSTSDLIPGLKYPSHRLKMQLLRNIHRRAKK